MSMVKDAVESDAEEVGRRRQPLARGVELLTYMIESKQDTHGVRELAGRLGVSPSTAHRLVTDLERLGLVRRAESGTSYRLGLEFLRLAWLTTSRYPVHDLSEGVLRRLVEQTGESAFFSLYSEQRREMMFTLSIESPHPLRYALPLQQWLPLHGGASGLAIFAYLPDAVRREVAAGPLEPLTERTVIEPEKVLERLETVRKEGYAITHGERIEGAVAIAAPVFGPSGEVIGAAGVSIPEARYDAGATESLAFQVRQAAAEITTNIQGRRGDR
ncbi:IclR family acetate operon transcriptional repressor [Leifsonia sp. EB41]|uniref:IclR family transcriptional regulator n=1 Tax=Leifsonia sp. EB41 TaxID=3156260 RepID=UPI0035140984